MNLKVWLSISAVGAALSGCGAGGSADPGASEPVPAGPGGATGGVGQGGTPAGGTPAGGSPGASGGSGGSAGSASTPTDPATPTTTTEPASVQAERAALEMALGEVSEMTPEELAAAYPNAFQPAPQYQLDSVLGLPEIPDTRSRSWGSATSWTATCFLTWSTIGWVAAASTA